MLRSRHTYATTILTKPQGNGLVPTNSSYTITRSPFLALLQSPNLRCFIERVASYPERLQYIYFNVVLLLRAVARIGPYLTAYDYCSSSTAENTENTLQKLDSVIRIAQNGGKFDETLLFRDDNANVSVHIFVCMCDDRSNRCVIMPWTDPQRRVQNSLP